MGTAIRKKPMISHHRGPTEAGIYALIRYTYSRALDTGFSDGLGSVIGATYFPLPNYQNLDWGLSGGLVQQPIYPTTESLP
jgi:hypothetical protein